MTDKPYALHPTPCTLNPTIPYTIDGRTLHEHMDDSVERLVTWRPCVH